jgi:hypothetical protein
VLREKSSDEIGTPTLAAAAVVVVVVVEETGAPKPLKPDIPPKVGLEAYNFIRTGTGASSGLNIPLLLRRKHLYHRTLRKYLLKVSEPCRLLKRDSTGVHSYQAHLG